jgi:nitrate/nitrite transport system permease protein
MVSAVFHSPLPDALVASKPVRAEPVDAAAIPSTSSGRTVKSQAAPAPEKAPRVPFDWRGVWLRVLPPVLGLGLLVLIWELVALRSSSGFPSPAETFKQALTIFSDPFYRKGPNDQGIGWNLLSSLQRVAVGFGLAAVVGIPAGFMIGRFEFLSRMFNPLISLLRPVSPLAWLPIGLMNVARVLNLSEWKIFTKILLPSVLPYMLTGVRLAVGTAWLVIVAAEMLTGGVGIGFWIWDEWNNLNVRNIIIAIFVIGVVGLILEYALIKLATAFTFEEVKS